MLTLVVNMSASFPVTAQDSIPVELNRQVDALTVDDLPKNVQALLEANTDSNIGNIRSDSDLSSITHENEDGSFTANVFGTPVKYIDKNGDVQFIDTSFTVSRATDGYDYANAANNLLAEYSKDAEKGFRLTKDGFSVSMSVFTEPVANKLAEEMPETDGITVDEEFLSIETSEEVRDSTEPLEVATVERKPAEIRRVSETGQTDEQLIYPEAFGKNTRIEYTNISNGIKEDIILEENIGMNTFSFLLYTGELIPILSEDGKSLVIVEPNSDWVNDEDTIKYEISPLYVYDSYTPTGNEERAGDGYEHFTYDCYYDLEPLSDGEYKLTAVVSDDYLNDPRTVYPVTVDPTVTETVSNLNITDMHQFVSGSTYTVYNQDTLAVGYYGGGSSPGGYYYSFIKYTVLPTLPSNVDMTSIKATLKMKLYSSTTTNQANISRATYNWGTATTANITYTATSGGVSPSSQFYNFNVSNHVSDWYNGYSNYGWRIASQISTDSQYSMYAGHTGNGTNRPVLTISYITPDTSITDGIYFIKNKNSGKYLDVLNINPAPGAQIQQWNYNGCSAQQWKVTYLGNYQYSFAPLHALDKRLDIYYANDADTTKVQIEVSNNTNAQKFYITKDPVNTGSYKIRPAISKTRVLEIAGGSTSAGALVWLYTMNAGTGQNWIFEKVTYTATVNNYYDHGYHVFYGETESVSRTNLTSYATALKTRYNDLLGLNITFNTPTYFASGIDNCKGTVTSSNIDNLCVLPCQKCTKISTDRPNVISNFNLTGSNKITNIYWSGHRIKSVNTAGTIAYNRSCSSGDKIIMIERSTSTDRTQNSTGVAMHELNHQYGVKDHYHELAVPSDASSCKFKNNGCKTCNPITGRPESCIMNNSRQDINNANIMCIACKDDLWGHLADHHV